MEYTKKEARKKLVKMVQGNVWRHRQIKLNNIVREDETITKALNELDKIEFLVDDIDTYDVDKCKVVEYGVNADEEERCVSALMVRCGKKPLAIGFTED